MPEFVVKTGEQKTIPWIEVKDYFSGCATEAQRLNKIRQLAVDVREQWRADAGSEGYHEEGAFMTTRNNEATDLCMWANVAAYLQGNRGKTLWQQAFGAAPHEELVKEVDATYKIFKARAQIESNSETALDIFEIRKAIVEVGIPQIEFFMKQMGGVGMGADGVSFLDEGTNFDDFTLRGQRSALVGQFRGLYGYSDLEAKTALGASEDFYVISSRYNERGGYGKWKRRMAVMTNILTVDRTIWHTAYGVSDYVSRNAHLIHASMGSYLTEAVRPYWRNVTQDPREIRDTWRVGSFELRNADYRNHGKELATYYFDMTKVQGIVDLASAFGATLSASGGLLAMVSPINNKEFAQKTLPAQLGSKIFGQLYPAREEFESTRPEDIQKTRMRFEALLTFTSNILQMVLDYYVQYDVGSPIGRKSIHQQEMEKRFSGHQPEHTKVRMTQIDVAPIVGLFFGWFRGSRFLTDVGTKYFGSVDKFLRLYEQSQMRKNSTFENVLSISSGVAGQAWQELQTVSKAGKVF